MKAMKAMKTMKAMRKTATAMKAVTMKAAKAMKTRRGSAGADPPAQKNDAFIVQIVGCPTRGTTKVVCSLTDTVGTVCSRLELMWGMPDIELMLGAEDSLPLSPIAVIGDLGIKLSRRLFSRETTPVAAVSTASSTTCYA